MSITRQELQIAADIRLMAMSATKVAGHDAGKQAYLQAMGRIKRDCEILIAAGPADVQHILEDSACAAEIDHELRKRTYPGSYA